LTAVQSKPNVFGALELQASEDKKNKIVPNINATRSNAATIPEKSIKQ